MRWMSGRTELFQRSCNQKPTAVYESKLKKIILIDKSSAYGDRFRDYFISNL